MSLTKCPVFALLLTFLSTFNRGDADAEVCVIPDSCILPCSFQPGDDIVMHWIKVTDTAVHSYYHNADQPSRQSPRYKGRTSLFKDQLPRGNASLLLKRVEVQDQGKYKCYTSTITGNKVSFIDVDVEAPVRKINVRMVENIITCSSDGIYPTPQLTWSTNPPSDAPGVDEATVETEQLTYNIRSSLMLSDNVSQGYSCNISNGRRGRTATWYKPTSMDVLNTETTIVCNVIDPASTRLVWTFNQSQIILSRTGNSDYAASEKWEKLVKDVSESGSLILQGLSSDHDGMYSCEQSNDEETLITNTILRIENSPGHAAAITGAVVGVIGVIIIIIGIILVVLFKYKESICKKSDKNAVKYAKTKQRDDSKPQQATG